MSPARQLVEGLFRKLAPRDRLAMILTDLRAGLGFNHRLIKLAPARDRGWLYDQSLLATRATDNLGSRIFLLHAVIQALHAHELTLSTLEAWRMDWFVLMQRLGLALREPISASDHARMRADGSLDDQPTAKAVKARVHDALSALEVNAKQAEDAVTVEDPVATAAWRTSLPPSLALGGYEVVPDEQWQLHEPRRDYLVSLRAQLETEAPLAPGAEPPLPPGRGRQNQPAQELRSASGADMVATTLRVGLRDAFVTLRCIEIIKQEVERTLGARFLPDLFEDDLAWCRTEVTAMHERAWYVPFALDDPSPEELQAIRSELAGQRSNIITITLPPADYQ